MHNGVYKSKWTRHKNGGDREIANDIAEQGTEIFILLPGERIMVGSNGVGGRGPVASRAEYVLRTRP